MKPQMPRPQNEIRVVMGREMPVIVVAIRSAIYGAARRKIKYLTKIGTSQSLHQKLAMESQRRSRTIPVSPKIAAIPSLKHPVLRK